VATLVRHELLGCDGFRVESPRGLMGWVEETWLGAAQEPAALAVRTLDGRRGLLLAEDVDAVAADSELVLIGEGRSLRELDVPRVTNGSAAALAAAWTTTGRTLEPPSPPGLVQRALLAVRPWRLAPPPKPGAERPLWQIVAALYFCLALIVGLVIGLSFLAAQLAAGQPY
jgi:hypothetical protein